MTDFSKDVFVQSHLEIIRGLQSPKSGLFLAAAQVGVSTGYDKAWLRDNFYTSLAFEETGDMETTRQVWRAILDIFLKHEDKISWATNNKPQMAWQYIHARYHPEDFEEYWEEWGNKQNDAVGAILFKVGELHNRGLFKIETEDDIRIIQHLVDYTYKLEYWHDPDNGVWEEYEELHASSIGACVAGLLQVAQIKGINVPPDAIEKGQQALEELLPRESSTKFTDLALASLLWPYKVVSRENEDLILRKLSYYLERDKGVIRYKNDAYYNNNEDGYSEEAEWCMGLPWLSIIYAEKGDFDKAKEYYLKALSVLDSEGKMPELYYSNTDRPNENNPLGWAESLLVCAHIRLILAGVLDS